MYMEDGQKLPPHESNTCTFLFRPRPLLPQVAQELTYMAVWLRIPLVHPEAMDPELNGDSSSSSSKVSVKDIGIDASTTDPALNGGSSSKDAPAEAAVSGGQEQAAAGGGKSVGARVEVEDPWETWNAIRVMCEHKSW